MQKRYFLSFQYLFIDFVTIYLSSIIYNDHKNISVKYELQSTILYRDILKNVILANLLLSCPERLFLNAFIYEKTSVLMWKTNKWLSTVLVHFQIFIIHIVMIFGKGLPSVHLHETELRFLS